MNNLEVGMYVRTKDGYIRKCVTVDLEDIDSYELDDFIPNEYGDFINWLNEDELNRYIAKTSHNIINLIEVGDYVNGFEVQSKDINEKTVICYTATFFEDEIETIITHEQIESMRYKVGE